MKQLFILILFTVMMMMMMNQKVVRYQNRYVALEDPINHENTMESRELTRFQNQDEPNNEPSNET